MKRTLRRVYETLILATGLFALAACSSDNGEGPAPKEFPTFGDIKCMVGDEGEIIFNAYTTWTLSSDKTWFKLAGETGVAGEQSIAYNVTDHGLEFKDDEATITFGMDGKTASFKATRSAKERTLKLYTKVYDNETGEWAYNEVESIDLEFLETANTYKANFGVIANYDWKIALPAWITMEQDDMSAEANADAQPADVTYKWLEVDLTGATANDMKGEITFADQKASEKSISKGITCPGAKNYMLPDADYETKITAEGKYVHSGMVNGEWQEEIIEDAYTFTAKAGYDGIVFFKVWKDGNYYGVDASGSGNYDYNARWCGVDVASSKNLGPGVKEYTYELWASANDGSKRAATIIGLPDAMAEGLTAADLVASGDEQIKEQYQAYIITELTQETANSGGIEMSMNVEGVTLARMAEGDELDGIKSNYGVEEAYVLTYTSFEQATWFTLNLTGSDGETELTAIYDPEEAALNTKARTGWLEFTPQAGMEMGVYITDQYVPWTAEREALVIIRNPQTFMNEAVIKIVQQVAKGEE